MIRTKKRTVKAAQKKVKPKAVEAYMPLVHSIASMVSGKGLPPNIEYDDLVSDGTVGMMKAWENFDPNRGVKFETYASYRIRGEILDGLKNYSPVPYRVQVMVRHRQKGPVTLQQRLVLIVHLDDEPARRAVKDLQLSGRRLARRLPGDLDLGGHRGRRIAQGGKVVVRIHPADDAVRRTRTQEK